MAQSYAKIIESLKGLITENTSAEEAEKIAGIVKDVEAAKQESDDLLIKHEELRQKYITALKQTAFNNDPKPNPDDDKPKTLEECIEEVIEKRDDK